MDIQHSPSKTTQNRTIKKVYDVAIIGAGPAGHAAALWLARFLHDIVVIDSGDPRNWQTRSIHGFLGLPNIQPAELHKISRQQCIDYGVSFIDTHVESTLRSSESANFQLINHDHADIFAKRILLAVGLRDNWPKIPGLERCYGSTIHTCPFCDGYEARNSRIAVIGSGHKAATVATTLRSWSPTVIICTNGQPTDMNQDSLTALTDLNVPIFTEQIQFLQARYRTLHHITFAKTTDIPCDHIFIALGQHPPDGPVNTLGCQCDNTGRVIVDSHFQTTIPGVYAAGDITPGLQLAMRAASQGIDAAVAIHRSLIIQRK